MWNYVKRGFGYGFGGRIGWELGGLIWGLFQKLIALIALAVGATVGVPWLADSVGAYNDLQQKYEQQGVGHAHR